MNYRHSYHAGNFADVLKHAVLALVLEYMKRKQAPFRVIDTHAGAGRYALTSAEAEKTGEWQGGIARLTGPGAKPLPSSPYTTNLLGHIRSRKLDVAQLVHVHGGMDPFSALVETANRRGTN